MPEAWQSAFVEVVPDFSKFRGQANSQMSGILGDAGDGAGRSSSDRFGGSFVGGVGRLAVPIAGAIAALGIGNLIGDAVSSGIDYAFNGIQLAGALQQSAGAVEAVFGEQSKVIQDFAANANQDLGLTANSYNELATVLGSQLRNGGTAIDQVAGKTASLIQVGADLSAMFGGPTSDAVNAVSAALRGERDTIERYGVSLTQAAVDAKAAELGFTKVGGALSTQANQAATLALIMDQTGAAQGRFAAESGTLAGQQQRLGAAFEEAQTRLGTALLPALTQLATLANTQLVPVLNSVIDEVGPQLASALATSVPAITSMVLAFAPLVPDLVRLATEALPPTIQLLTALAPILIDVASNTGSALSTFNAFSSYLKGDTSLRQTIQTVTSLTGSMGEAASAIYRWYLDTVVSFKAVVSTVQGLGSSLYSAGRDFIQGFINGASSIAGTLFARVTAPFRNLVGGVKDLLGIASPSKVMAEIGGYTYQGFALGVSEAARKYDVEHLFAPSVPGSLTASRVVSRATAAGALPGGPTGAGAPTVVVQGNVYGDPMHVAEVIVKKQDRAARRFNLGVPGVA